MSKGVNRVTLIGNLGADPELRETTSGTKVANIRLAVNGREKRGDEFIDVTEWMNVVCFGKLAEIAGTHLSKGRQVYVEGRIKTNKVGDGEDARYYTDVVANDLTFIGKKEEAPF